MASKRINFAEIWWICVYKVGKFICPPLKLIYLYNLCSNEMRIFHMSVDWLHFQNLKLFIWSIHFTDFIDGIPKDIDLRVELIQNIGSTGLESAPINDSNKRLSEESDANEPKNKKTKSEKIDM